MSALTSFGAFATLRAVRITSALAVLLTARAAAWAAYLAAISLPKKSRSGLAVAAAARNNPFPLPISTSSGADRSKTAAGSHGHSKSSTASKIRPKSIAGSSFGSARRPIAFHCCGPSAALDKTRRKIA